MYKFIENTLNFVCNTIDGKLVVCDDGYVIECYVHFGSELKRVDYIFNLAGILEKTEIKGQ